jgi:quinol monooxygenase YgiN
MTEPYNSFPKSGNRILIRGRKGATWTDRARRYVGPMTVTVILELRFKPDEVAAGRELMGRALQDTRAFDGNVRTDVLVDEDDEAHWLIYEIWETVENDEAYRAFRAGEGKLTQLPPLLAAPPVKTRYITSDV